MICADLRTFRSTLAVVLVRLLSIGLLASTAVSALAQTSGTWATTGNLNVARCAHTATLLPNGLVLVAGGEGANSQILSSAELYDPATGKWSVTGGMSTPRYGHTATLLQNGQVLVVGGSNSLFLDSAELYNPSTGQWRTTGSMTMARTLHGAALLENGEVLVAGGVSPWWPGSTGGSPTASAETYDPNKGTWRTTGSMIYATVSHATRLLNGQVLVPGGNNITAELYDASAGKWTLTSNMYFSQPSTDAVLLTNGEVLIYGSPNSTTYSSEFYNPTTNIWARTFGQNYGNIESGPITLLDTGKVLLAGGAGKYSSILSFAMLYNPSTNYWTLTGSLNQFRRSHTLTLLPNGKALAAGGVSRNPSGATIIIASAELYTP
jgi:N-acetylneuraminic acid mutarotase